MRISGEHDETCDRRIPIRRLSVPQNQTANPLIATSKAIFDISKRDVMGSVESIPEDLWSFQPTKDVRTVAQLFAHIADGQYEFCGAAIEGKPVDKGWRRPRRGKPRLSRPSTNVWGYQRGWAV